MHKATAVTKAVEKQAEKDAEAQAQEVAESTGGDSGVDDVAKPLEELSEAAGPSDASKQVQAKSMRSRRAPILSTKEVSASYGPKRPIRCRDI